MANFIRINPITDALLVIDAQPTFMPGGGLAVAGGDEILPVIHRLMPYFEQHLLATRDRHPRGHISLASSYRDIPPMTTLDTSWIARHGLHLAPHALFTELECALYLNRVGGQVLWPDHAIAGTDEAALHPSFGGDGAFDDVFVKGLDPKCDSYSAFFDNLHRPSDLGAALRNRGVKRVFLCGLAFDYCVGWSAEGAIEEGFKAVVIEDATRPVGFPEGSVDQMKASFVAKGIRLVQSSEIHI